MSDSTEPSQASQTDEGLVPFHKANIKHADVVLIDGMRRYLPNDRIVELWRIKEQNGLCFRIYRPTDDGKTSELAFGLERDSAMALWEMLHDQLIELEVQARLASQSTEGKAP